MTAMARCSKEALRAPSASNCSRRGPLCLRVPQLVPFASPSGLGAGVTVRWTGRYLFPYVLVQGAGPSRSPRRRRLGAGSLRIVGKGRKKRPCMDRRRAGGDREGWLEVRGAEDTLSCSTPARADGSAAAGLLTVPYRPPARRWWAA